MTKHLLAGAAAVVLMSGVASAQTFPAYPPAPPVAPPAAAPLIPPAPVPGSSTTTTTTVAPTPGGDYRTTTTKKGMDANGNEITKKDTYREGVEGSTETHTKIETDPAGGEFDNPLDDHHSAAVKATSAGSERRLGRVRAARAYPLCSPDPIAG